MSYFFHFSSLKPATYIIPDPFIQIQSEAVWAVSQPASHPTSYFEDSQASMHRERERELRALNLPRLDQQVESEQQQHQSSK